MAALRFLMAWVDKSEDELTEAIEAAEGTKDLNAIVGILVHATAGDLDEMGPVRHQQSLLFLASSVLYMLQQKF